MSIKKTLAMPLILGLLAFAASVDAAPSTSDNNDCCTPAEDTLNPNAMPTGAGHVIQIHTRVNAFIGKPQLLLIIQDLDHNQTIPYLFTLQKGENYWVAYTAGSHYRIAASKIQFLPYDEKIDNFCHLESGKVRKTSLYVSIKGKLTPQTTSYRCDVSKTS